MVGAGRLKAALLAAAALLLSSQAGAQPAPPSPPQLNGNALLTDCDRNDHNYLEFFCIGYLRGVTDGIGIAEAANHSPHLFCFRPGVDFVQIKDIVVAHLRAHPETRDRDAYILIIASLQAAFPCPAR